jgi:hypothetical protein
MRLLSELSVICIVILGFVACSNEEGALKTNEEENEEESVETDGDRKNPSLPDVVFPCISLCYVDNNNNNLLSRLGLDDSKTHNVINDKNIFEMISIVDRQGVSHETGAIIMWRNTMISFTLSDYYEIFSPEEVQEYTLKYKIPPLLGKDHVEELKVTFNVNGTRSSFTKDIWYNKKKLVFDGKDDVVVSMSNYRITLTFKVDK